MKRIVTISFLLSLVSILSVPTQLFTATRGIRVTVKTPQGKNIDLYRDSYALVIGNGSYKKGWDPLPGAIRDAQEVAGALRRNGFEVTLKTDLTADAFNRVLSEFVLRYGKEADNRLLFYYAGHGHTQKMATGEDLGYLVMIDAPAPEKDPVGFSLASVDMQTLVTQAKMIRSKHVLFMFDSCFSGTVLNLRERVTPSAISDKVRYPVRQFITAGGADEPVPDRSVFKEAFLDILEGRDREPIQDGYLTGEELGLYLKNKVPEYNPVQHPQYGKIRDPKLDKGDFVFVLARSGGAVIEKPGGPSTRATLRVRANVSGATVYLDGEERGLTPVTIDDIGPGRYRVKVIKDGYEAYEERVMVNPGKELEVRAHLERLMTTGTISLSGSPKGAQVYLDGYYAGNLPCTLERVEAGAHSLQVKKDGHQDWEERVMVRAGQALSVIAHLQSVALGPGKIFTNSSGMEFVYVSPGTFEMGSPRKENGRDKDEREHSVTLTRPFYMQTTEVTQGQWKAVMGHNPSSLSGDEYPVHMVSWNDCQAFIRRLNEMEGIDKYRLPTEAEWEYTCRGGSGSIYSFGHEVDWLDKYVWYWGNAGTRPHPVGQKKPNDWGLYDMHGNVWEWCQDWYGRYPRGHVTDPKGPSSGRHRVIRGGSWVEDARDCRSANRRYEPPDYEFVNIGFRLAMTLD